MSQAAIDLASCLAGSESGIERGLAEQGVSQGIEADRFVKLGQLRRCSECGDGSAVGLKLAVTKEPAKESGKLSLAISGRRSAFCLAGDSLLRLPPIVGRAQEERRPRRDRERLGVPSHLDDGFGLQEGQLVKRESALEEPGLRMPGVRGAESRVFE